VQREKSGAGGCPACVSVVDPVVQSSPPRNQVRSAIGWSYLLTTGRLVSAVVVTFVLALLLGPREFGLIAMALVFITVVQTLIQQGLVSAIVQRDQLDARHLDAAFRALLLAGTVFGLLTAAASPLWALMNRAPELTAVCLALAPLVPIQALVVVPEAVLRRELQFRSIALRTLAAALISGAVGIGLALAGAGIWALVAQQLVNGAIGLVVVWLVCPWRPSRKPAPGALRQLWAFSAHSANAGIGTLLSNRADIIVAGLFFGPAATGIYRLAARLPDVLVEATVRSLQQVALPSLSRLQSDREAFAAHLARLQHFGAALGLPALGVLAATATPLVAVLGPQWSGTQTPMRLLCLYAAANVYRVLLGPALQAIGRPARLAAVTWAGGLLGVATLVALGVAFTGAAPVRQASMIALGGIAVQFTVSVFTVWLTVRRTVGAPLRGFLAPTVPAVLAGLVAGLVVPAMAARLSVERLVPLAQLVLLAAAAAAAAAAVLWVTDRRVRALVRERLRGAERVPLSEPGQAEPQPAGRR